MPVVTPELVASALRLDLNDAGPYLTLLCDAANRTIEDYCHRHFDRATVTEYHDIDTGDISTLYVRRPPIIRLTSVTDDANTTIQTGRSNRSISITADVELYPAEEPNRIRLVNNESVFSTGSRAAKIVYTGGYEEKDMPADLRLAGVNLVSAWWEGPEALARRQQIIDGNVIMWRDEAIPPQVKQVLNKYRLEPV